MMVLKLIFILTKSYIYRGNPLVKEVKRRKASIMAELMIEGNMPSTQVGANNIFKMFIILF